MAVNRKLPILLYIILSIGLWTPLYAQDLNHGWNGVSVKVISPEVSVIREGSSLPMYKWGMTLDEKDEIQTGKNGKASIHFSSAKNGNEIILGPSTRVSVSRTAIKVDYSVYQITVIQGKIWVKDRPVQSRKVLVHAGKSNILPFGGDYVVEQRDESTLTANTKGNVRIRDPSSNRYTSILAGEIAAVSGKTGELTIMSIPEPLMSDFSSKTVQSSKTAPEIRRLVEDRKAQVISMVNAIEKKEREKKKAEKRAKEREKVAAATALAAAAAKAKAKQLAAQKATVPEVQKTAKPTMQKTTVPVAQKTELAEASQADVGQKKQAPLEEQKTLSETAKMSVAPVEEKQPVAEKTEKPTVAGEKTGKPTKTEKEPEVPAATKRKVAKPTQKVVTSVKPVEAKTPAVMQKAEEPFWLKYNWHIVTGSSILLFSWMSVEEAKKFNDLETENDLLKTQWANATTSTARTALEVQYEVNKSKMSTYNSNVSLYNNLSYLAICLEGYLLYREFFGSDSGEKMGISQSSNHKSIFNPDTIAFGFSDPSSFASVRLSAGWKW